MNPEDDRTESFVPLAGGTMVGHYRIIERIGSGGMGEVYLAEDTQLKRRVALKFLPANMCADENCRNRFKREAQATAKLNHPNIVHIYDVSEFNGRPFFAMEHVEGVSLYNKIKEKRISIDEAIDITRQICEGLQEAHEAGIVHRDIKPGNIIIDMKNRPRLLDFGLATIRGAEKLTKIGSTMGTIGYMSPEQVNGQKVDVSSDLFSVGVILYEMITGQRPFQAEYEAATLNAILHDTPEPLSRYKAGVTDELQQVVNKALEKNPDTRYQHADDMLADLKRISSSSEKQTKIIDRWNRYVVPSAVVVLLIIITVWWFGWRDKTDVAGTDKKIMLAVLPFENLGDPDDEYFADGVTDEVISKLTRIGGLGVISRTSSITYKGTEKTLPQIAHELGVSYVLEGTIRWEKADTGGRVRITPQLIDVTNDSHIWSESYERALSGVFAIQSEIAEEVSNSLDIVLLENDRPRLAAGETDNTEAYLAYLRGLRFSRQDVGRAYSDKAIAEFETAVRLDPGFTRAWSALSIELSWYYQVWDNSDSCLERAENSARKALQLGPGLADGHLALGNYFYRCLKDYDKALKEFAIAEATEPGEFRNIEASAYVWRRQGKVDRAANQLLRALELNPRDAMLLSEIASTYLMNGDYGNARYYGQLAAAIAPEMSWSHYVLAITALVSEGDLVICREELQQAGINQSTIDTWFRLLIDERDYLQAIKTLDSSGVRDYQGSDGYIPTYLFKAEVLRLAGHTAEAYIYFDSARVILEQRSHDDPENVFFLGSLGLAYAGLGRDEEAVSMGRKAVELCPVEKDAMLGPSRIEDLIYIYLMTGMHEPAIRELDYLLSIPGWVSTPEIRLDPRFDSIRDNPEFKAMIRKHEKSDASRRR